jgi:hypothetical protein
MDIAGGIEAFCETQWPDEIPETSSDAKAVYALHNKQFDRSEVIKKWLESYSVFQGLRQSQRVAITDSLIAFFDSNPQLDSRDLLFERFQRLSISLRENADLLTKNGRSRKIDSLTSKALWLCYPSEVPILDLFAENALRVIARLHGLSIQPRESRYERFTALWFAVYDTVKPQITRFADNNSVYAVRVFDRYLWWLGQDSYQGLISQ